MHNSSSFIGWAVNKTKKHEGKPIVVRVVEVKKME